ncbi:preprotein translocase subunit YajC [Granulicella rosea]|uniref:preprotein translocase subunit YajC n=1 Tax=Granulicella rosea TaxID=474952 RepID=UPI001FEC7FA9|nr:preprotein translocase subunit YajC [Granulicella rosea]
MNLLATWLFQSVGGFNLSSLTSIAPLVLMFVAFYFLLIVPNQRKQKTWAAMLAALKSGDRVTTNGGLRGTILQVKDDTVTLRLPPDGLKVEVVKSAIATVTTDEPAK